MWPAISGAGRGTNVRRRRLHPQNFVNYKIPLPARDKQEIIRNVAYKIDAGKRLQTEIVAELDALLPSILDHAFRGEL